MTHQEILSASSAILDKARQSGLSLAGFASVDDLQAAPSVVFSQHLPSVDKVAVTLEDEIGLNPAKVRWPAQAKSLLAVALEHPEDKPELDWWCGKKSPPGNTLLIDAVTALCDWIPANFNIDVYHFPYFIEQGGIYLKDAAVMAGLGCIGRNNLMVTPEFGPRVRLRAMALSVPMPSTGPSGFDPCVRCDAPCRKACPQHAFDDQIHSPDVCNQTSLPGRDGNYARPTCYIQMRKTHDEAREQLTEGFSQPVKVVKSCRRCEWSCPVGKKR